MKKIFRTKGQLILEIFILATLLFIFAQSFMPQRVSQDESNSVAGFLEVIFPSDTAIGSFIQNNVRKIAHFVEFAFLGVLTSLYTVKYLDFKKFKFINLFFGLPVGFTDESIQILSGRGPAISDVWLDFFGYLFGVLVIYLFALAVARRKRNR